MSSSIKTNKTPPFVLYILSLTLTITVATAVSNIVGTTFGVTNSPSASQILASNANVLLFGSLLIVIEILVLRYSFGLLGFLIAFILEIVRLFYFAQDYRGSDSFLYLALYVASIFSIFVSKLFRGNVETVSSKQLAKNAQQVIPAIAIILIFAGSTIMTTLGFAPVSQVENPQNFNVGNIDFNTFKVPSWNAQYYLDNILDQFQAGMNNPFKPVFNVTNNSPDPLRFTSGNEKISSYLKQQTYFAYKYDAKTAKSGTFFPAETGITTQNLYLSGTKFANQTFSTPVPDSLLLQHALPPAQRTYNAYNLTVSYPINHTSLYQESSLPVPWNSRTYGTGGQFFGSFINPNSTQVFTQNGNFIASCPPSGNLSSCAFTENEVNIQNFPGISDVGLRLDGFSSAGTNNILNYTMNYLEPNYNYIDSHSGTAALYQSVFSPATWAAINATYLQTPDWPNGATSGTTPNASVATYQDWAPLVYQVKNQYYNPTATVMANIHALLNAMKPAIHSNYLNVNQPGGPLNLTFDADYWINGTYLVQKPGVQYPAPGQDYVNWFLTVKNGLSSNFASAATMILRAEGIPARFVTGYALGNTSSSASSNPYVTVYQRLHKMAWTEALVPLNTPNGLTFEWVIVDPIGGTLAPLLGLNLAGSTSGQSSNTGDFVTAFDPFLFNQTDDLTTQAGQTNFAQSVFRVGIDQKNRTTGLFDNAYDPIDDNGYLGSNGPLPNTTTGMVKVGVYVDIVHVENGSVTSFYPAGSTAVTFQVLYFNNATNAYTSKPWNETATKSVVMSDPVTGLATTYFQYYPFYSNLTTVLHGTGPVNIVAILGNTLTVDSASCHNGNTLNCTIGISDSNRTDDTFNPTNFFVRNINYDPMHLVTGNPPLAIMGSNYLQNAVLKASVDAISLNNFYQKIITSNATQSAKQINSSLSNLFALGVVFSLLQYVVVVKRK